MESFAKHAGRTTVTTDDVMLLARRNEGLEAVLRGLLEEQRSKKGDASARGRR
jgi:centromere protein S